MNEGESEILTRFHQPLVALSNALHRKRLVVVVGAGASIAAGLPSWNELVIQLRSDLGLPPANEPQDPRLLDPLYVAEMYEKRFDRPSLMNKVVEMIDKIKKPSQIHQAIAKMNNVQTIFTTNYDDLMERALEKAEKSFHIIYRDEDYAYLPPPDQKVVIKLHGDIRNPSRMVLTRSDMLDYETTHRNLLDEFKTALKKNTALFIGASMLDPNLERMLELSVRELRENSLRHYMLVKGWNESLKIYYSQHKLEPVPLDNWDEAVNFLKQLGKYGVSSVKEPISLTRSLPNGYIVVEAERFQELTSQEERRLAERYNQLAGRYRKGARQSILNDLKELWGTLAKRFEEQLNPLKVRVLILLSHITASYENEIDFHEPDEWLKEAEAIADDLNRTHVQELRCLLMHLKGQTDGALKALSNIRGDSALGMRLLLLLDIEDLSDAAPLVEHILPKTSTDEESAKIAIRYYLLMDQLSEARRILDPWAEQSGENAILLELAGYVYAKLARERREAFCRKHNLFPYFSIILFHEELLDCRPEGTGAISAKYFRKAAGLFRDLGEKEAALRCYENLFAVRQMCKASAEELQQLTKLMHEVSRDEATLGLNDVSGEKPLEAVQIDDFEQALKAERFIAYALVRLEGWAKKTGAWQEAAALLERPELQEKITTVEDQALMVMTRMRFWENANESNKALQAIDSFVPPVEYAYLPLVLRAGHFMFERQDQAAGEILNKLKEFYPKNPIVLAQLCEWYELQDKWEPMELTAEELLELISIPQTYDYYLTSLGKQQKLEKLLEGLERAKAEQVQLGPTWTHVNRARALMGLLRFEEALDTYLNTDQKLLKPNDCLEIIRAYALTDNRDEALRRAEDLIQTDPNLPEAHGMLIQLLTERNDINSALEASQRAAQLFPNNEQIQGSHIHLLVLSGQTEGIADKIQEFQRRFPESKVLRSVPQEQLFKVAKQSFKQANFAEGQYILGRIPAIQTEFLQSSSPSYFRFWHLRKKYKAGLYVACGEQGQEWRRLLDPAIRDNGAVMDFPALVTLFELQKQFKSWEGILQKCFPKIYLPASFREVIAMERSSLFGQIQTSRFRALQDLRNRMDNDREKFRSPIQASDIPGDVLGEESERTYATEHDLFYLNEYGDDKGRIPKEFGFQELAVHLSGRGVLTTSQQQKLEKLARTNRAFQPLPTSRESLKEIVAGVSTLEALVELDLCEPTVNYFEIIHVSELGKARLREEILSTQFTQEVAERFQDFERYLKRLEEWIEWVPVSEHERNRLIGNPIKQVPGSLKHVMIYLADLFAVALQKKCVLITDDRTTKTGRFSKERADELVRIGSDTLLRYFYHRPENSLGHHEYTDCYRQLINWNYLHLPLDVDVIMDAWPDEELRANIPAESPIQYFSHSLAEYLNAIAHEKRLANIMHHVADEHGRQLALLLRRAFRTGKAQHQVAEIFKLLEPSFINNMFKEKFPETFPLVLAHLLAIGDENRENNEESGDKIFLEWLESVLELAGINRSDIASAWQSYILRITMAELPEIAPYRAIQEKTAVVAYLMRVLPESTKDSVFVQHVNRILEEKLNLKIPSRDQ